MNNHASGDSVCHTKHNGNGILSVTGVHLATIKEAQRAEFDHFGAGGRIPIITAIRGNAPPDLNICYVDGSNILDAYCHTLCGNDFNKQCDPPVDIYVDFEISKKALLKYLALSPLAENLEPGEIRFLEYAYDYFKNHPFFTTHEGYFGFGPSGTRPGDQICVFLGCKTSMILRPAEDGNLSGRWTSLHTGSNGR